jgi:Tol biopolymer transport system component
MMEGLTDVELSPDGSLFAYGCNGSDALCVADFDGTDEREIVQGSGDAINATSWSPDGTRIPYFTFHAQDVFIVDVATGKTWPKAVGRPGRMITRSSSR